MLDVYWLPHCKSCQKLVAYLEERDEQIRTLRNLKEDPLDRSEVRALAEGVGGADVLFSRRARKYREMGLHERDLGEEEMLDLMASEYTFISRPVIMRPDGSGVAGSSRKRLDALLEDEGS